MGIDLKYGKVTTERGSIPDDEPVFVIRARDSLAVRTLQEYYDLADDDDCSEEFCDAVDAATAVFVEWQKANYVKQPD